MKKINKMCVLNLITSEVYHKHTEGCETLHGTKIKCVPTGFRELRPTAPLAANPSGRAGCVTTAFNESQVERQENIKYIVK